MPGHFENSFASQQPVHQNRHGPVQSAYNPYFSACFFFQLEQCFSLIQISRSSISACFFSISERGRIIELLVEESILFLVTSLQNCKVVHSTCCYANLSQFNLLFGDYGIKIRILTLMIANGK
jgi:hypothetical protein